MLQDLNPTTRCFHRTLADAFPKDYYEWWEDPPSRHWSDAVYFWLGIALWVVIAFIYWRYL